MSRFEHHIVRICAKNLLQGPIDANTPVPPLVAEHLDANVLLRVQGRESGLHSTENLTNTELVVAEAPEMQRVEADMAKRITGYPTLG